MSDSAASILNDIIFRAVKGEASNPWPLDPAFEPKGSFKERFEARDKQILLWTIWDYARRGRPTPKWAAAALNEIMFSAVKGKLTTWDDAFGKIFPNRRHRRAIHDLAKYLIPVWKRVRELKREGHNINDELFYEVSREFRIGEPRVKKYYGLLQRYHRSRRMELPPKSIRY